MHHPSPPSPLRAGRILVATPELVDPNFSQTLVWLAEYSDEGALGFILNRPMDKTLGEVAGGPGLTVNLRAVPLGFGGPVRPDQLALVVFVMEAERLVCRWGLPPEQVDEYQSDPAARVRAYLGYAGWGEGQLDEEWRGGAWNVVEPDAAMLEPRLARGLWPLVIQGDERWKALRKHLPRDEQMN
jgi:putative transcriptional regulator